MTIKIQHDRPNCIGCAACAAVAPEFWSMHEDGKSDLKNAKPAANGGTELEIEEKDFELNKSAAEACPVNVIRVFKNGEKIV
ncbi:ferredoxin [Candidatus Micrarchaeota archaeon]|nr:ferredoxin [Candidatus Micrarchaeota archaeon]